MENRHCVACKQIFQPHPQSPHQSYCSSPDCQRQRKGLWQKNRLKTDPDYRDNQKRAQQAWKKRHPDYDRQYRKANPEHAERNRTLQRERNRRKSSAIAKMDASIPLNSLPSGIYLLSLVTDDPSAKMDAWTVEITVHACACANPGEIAKR